MDLRINDRQIISPLGGSQENALNIKNSIDAVLSKKSALAKQESRYSDILLSGMPGPWLTRSEVNFRCIHVKFTDRNVPIIHMII